MALPLHQRPPMRELGRRSEAADHPFKYPSLPGPHRAVSGPAPAMNLVPMVLAEQIGQRQAIAAACPAAIALGLTPGMAVTQARALIPDLDIRPANRAADAALLADLALHAVRHWTPTAAVSGSDGLWLDLSGVAHLHGGEARFCQRLVRFCRRFGLTARVTVASTPGAAHALARFGRDAILLVPGGQEAQALAPLPPAALRLTPEATAAANRFGLDRIADLLPLPRGPLARRLGMASVRRLDEALGRVPEPIVPVVPQETPIARLRLLEPIGTAEAIEQVIGDLLTDLIRQLVERGRGVRALILTLERIDGSEQHLSIGTARATRNAGHFARLFHLRIDRIDPGDGIEAMRLAAPRTDPLGATALAASLAGDDAPPDVAVLVDQIAGRVGEDALFTAAPVESDVPERAVRRWPPLAAPTGWPSWEAACPPAVAPLNHWSGCWPSCPTHRRDASLGGQGPCRGRG